MFKFPIPKQPRLYPGLFQNIGELFWFFLFNPWATYCEIFHSCKPMGFYLGGLHNVKT